MQFHLIAWNLVVLCLRSSIGFKIKMDAPPNIVILKVEQDLRENETLNKKMSPTIDQMSQNGIRFDYLASSDGRDYLLSRNHINDNNSSWLEPLQLQLFGYHTIGIGRWNFSYQQTTNLPTRHGFEEYFDLLQGIDNDLFFISTNSHGVTVDLKFPGFTNDLNVDQPRMLFATEAYCEMMVAKIKEITSATPIVLQLSLQGLKMNDKVLVGKQLKLLDDSVASVVTHLKSSDQWDNTVLLFLSENGRSEIRASGFLGGGFVERSLLAAGTTPYRFESRLLVADLHAAFLSLAMNRKEDPADIPKWLKRHGENQWQQLMTTGVQYGEDAIGGEQINHSSMKLEDNNDDGVSTSTVASRRLALTNTEILSLLYTYTAGASWIDKVGWLEGDPCTYGWYGITCSSGEVARIVLQGNDLQGSLPSQLGSLALITRLDVRQNSLTGSLPSQLGMWIETSYLNTRSNSFTGSLPSQLGQFTKMTSNIYMYSNRFTNSLPSQLGQITGLTKWFTFYDNSLSGPLPSQLGRLSKIASYFYIYSNRFSGSLPSQLGQLTGMTKYFYFYVNSFAGLLPSQLGRLTIMTSDLYFRSNSFTGSLPSQIGQMTKLTSGLSVRSNSFSGSLPSQLGRLTLLTSDLYLRSNSFTGSLPSQIGQLTKLTGDFSFRSNSFFGLLPSQLGQLSLIQHDLFGYSNMFSGRLPSQLGQLSRITTKFSFHANSFTGMLPSEMGRLTSLISNFDMYSNLFCGDLPVELIALSSQVTSGWNITAGNSFGTLCCETSALGYTCAPTSVPTQSPTLIPTNQPTFPPTSMPSIWPTQKPTSTPTFTPTINCQSGTYYEGRECVQCAIGRYSNFSSAPFPSTCSLCPTGKYNTELGASQCIQCATGKLSSADRTFCGDCNAGEYSLNNEECVSCEYGKYAPQALADSCLECAAGSHTNAMIEATSCETCDGGSFSNGSTPNCTYCLPGTFSSSGASECSDCLAGFASDLHGTSTCAACSAGTYTVVSGSVNCTSCGSGQYQGATGQSFCEGCEAGKVSSESGATSCTSCAAGRYSSNTSSTFCTSCSTGAYQGATGQSSCVACSSGTYSSSSGAVLCDNCPFQYTSTTGSSSCTLAAADYYLVYDDTSVTSEACPGHAECHGTDYAPAPEKNYWVDRSSYDYVADVYPCPRDTCQGATANSSCWRYAAYSEVSYDDDSCDADTLLCTEGAFGPLCGSCGDGYVYRGETKTCSKCGDAKSFMYTLFGIITGIIIAITITFACYRYGYLSLEWFRMGSVDSGSLKVAWVTYQIIISVSWNLDIKFPVIFTQMLSVMSVLSLEILSLECFQTQSAEERYYFTVYLWSMLPICFAVLITLIGLLRYLAVLSDSTKKSKIVSQHVWILLLWSYLVLPPVTMKQLQGLDCIPFQHDDSSYLRTATIVNCESGGYSVFKTVVILFFCLYQLIPLSWMFLLYQHRDALHIPFSQNEELSLNQRDANPSLSHLKFLFKDYRGTKWWFEVAEMYRRIMFIGVLPLFTPSSSKRASLGCMFAILSYVYFREEEPFREKFTNNIACMAQITILLTFYTALSIGTGVVIDFGLGDFGIGLFLVGTNLLVCMLVIYLTLTRYQRIKQEESWRRPLTTQQLSVVRRVMDEDSAPPPGSLQKSQEQQDAATSEMMSQILLRPSDVVMMKRVGAGAFGEVFKGTCMGEDVAIKTMIDVTEPNVREFKAEIVLTATLRHPNIVNFVGACWGKELMCLVLEWVAKGSLRDLLEVLELRWVDPLLRLATDVARGMNYLHNRKYYDEREGETLSCILHRDLKPDNALVSDFIAAKLADFGTSRAKGEEDVTMTAVGTPLYVAPEIARGELYDEKVDVYSFGLTLMEMCVQEPLLDFIGARWVIAFDKKKIPKAAMRIIRPMTEDGWRPVTDENPISFAPPTINSLIVRCCSHDPTQRPSFEEILEELNGKCKIEIDAAAFGRRIKDDICVMNEDLLIDSTKQHMIPYNSDQVTSNSLPKSGPSVERIIEMKELTDNKSQFGSVI